VNAALSVRLLIHRSSAFPASASGALGTRAKERFMFDILMLVLGLGFFVLAVGYTYACERL
jgi:hypothetical protein